MPIRFECTCGNEIIVPTNLLGREVRCPQCGKMVDVPRKVHAGVFKNTLQEVPGDSETPFVAVDAHGRRLPTEQERATHQLIALAVTAVIVGIVILFVQNYEPKNAQGKNAEQQKLSPEEERIDRLLAALASSDRRERQQAAEELRQLGPKIFQRVHLALKSKDETLRANAAALVGYLDDKRDAALLFPLLKDEAASVRWRAAVSLGKLKDEASVPHLIEALRDRDPQVRFHVRIALESITKHTVDKTATDPALIACLWEHWWREQQKKASKTNASK